jgi:hypothetical protein
MRLDLGSQRALERCTTALSRSAPDQEPGCSGSHDRLVDGCKSARLASEKARLEENNNLGLSGMTCFVKPGCLSAAL